MANARGYRAGSIDMLRGLVIVIMALDHVREYFLSSMQLDPTTNPDVDAGLFFTRWITHLCAPVFVFLAGTSAGLMSARKGPPELGLFLLKRGCWLVVVELFVISTGWTFAPGGIEQLRGLTMIILQVIWAIGVSMIILAGLQFFGRIACVIAGLMLVLGHNLLDTVWPATSAFEEGSPWWVILHSQASHAVGPFFVLSFYPLLPWIGLMLLGFGTCGVFEQKPARRDSLLVIWGVVLTIAFLMLRAVDSYGDPNHWQVHEGALQTVIDYLNVTKYPPSLLFVLMTLGPAAIVCAYADRIPDRVRQPLIVFGRAPFAFYVAHIYLIHALSIGLGLLQGYEARQFLTFMIFYPKGYGLPLPGVFAVWFCVVAALYPFSKWVVAVKSRRRDWWLSYV